MDLKNKYRKSFLGLFWALLYPLLLTLMMSIILSRVFQKSLADYVLYVYIGFVVWDFVVQASTQGSQAFIFSEAYIKIQKKPLLIYSLRISFLCLVQFLISFVGVLGWKAFTSGLNVNVAWIALVYGFLILIIWSFSLGLILAYITTFFRDFGQIVLLVFQLVWYISPIFIDKSAFQNGGLLETFNDWNPVALLLNIFREPIMLGEWPSSRDLLMPFVSGMALSLLAILVNARFKSKVIFYL
jgi:lipopolysaccharide transport system permease protein